MATDRQIAANQLNSLKSTGPKTIEGKEASRMNALQHGMAGAGVRGSDAFEERREAWGAAYSVEGVEAAWVLDRAVASSFRIERCEESFDAAVVMQMARARGVWDQDQRLEAAVLGSKIHQRPNLIAARLNSSRHGCELLIEHWGYLLTSLDAHGEWNELEIETALDLLGIATELRDGVKILEGPDPANLTGYRRALVTAEIDRLQTARDEVYGPLDTLKRSQTESGTAAYESKSAQLILRYEREAWNRYREAIKVLKALATQAEAANETKPISIAPPARPEPPAPVLPPDPPSTAPVRYGKDASGEFPGAMKRADITELLIRAGRLPQPDLNFSVGQPQLNSATKS